MYSVDLDHITLLLPLLSRDLIFTLKNSHAVLMVFIFISF